MTLNRRRLLWLMGATTSTVALGVFPKHTLAQSTTTVEEVFKVVPLPYAYDALEPYIDKETMQFHHDKHYVAYTKNLNAAINKYPELKTKSIEELLANNLAIVPEQIRTTVRNNGGGYLNHTMFWEIMMPPSQGGGQPKGEILKTIESTFGSFANFQQQFNEAASKVFGSGWAWLVLDKKTNELKIMTTPNQDTPLMGGIYPIMGNDVWEHAYYLKYRNNRGDYLKQWWNVVNWDEINRRYSQAKK